MREQNKRGATPPGATWRRRLLMGAMWAVVAGGAYWGGRFTTMPVATAEPAASRPAQNNTGPSAESPGSPIAYIYDSIPITREDLGEYLIARGGKDRVKNLINKRIIEHAAKQRGITVTDAEVSATLTVDAQQMGIEVKDFIGVILKKYNKSLFEWKEDVIKPRLILEKMCRSRVTVTREDIAMAYEAYFGAKIDCQMIMWPKEEKHTVLNKIWPAIRNNDKEFDHYARLCYSPSLAAVAGRVKPIGRNTTGDKKIEDTLFSLRDGEVSQVLDTPEGLVVFKRLKRIDPDTTQSFENARAYLEKEVMAKKVAMEIGKMFGELMAQAKPKNFLEASNHVQDAEQELIKNGIDPVKIAPSKALPAPAPGLPVPGTLPSAGK